MPNTQPLFGGSVDVELLTHGPLAERVVLHFDGEDGSDVALTITGANFNNFRVEDIATGTQQLGIVLGLPAMAQYDVQFALDDGVGTSVTLVERSAASE